MTTSASRRYPSQLSRLPDRLLPARLSTGGAAIGHDRSANRCPNECTPSKEENQVNVKRVIAWLLLAFVVFFIVTQPETSADMVRSAFRGLSSAASAFANFVTSLV